MAWVWYSDVTEKSTLLCKLDFGGRVVKATLGRASKGADEVPLLVLGIDEATIQTGVPTETQFSLTGDYLDRLVRAFVRDHGVNFDFSGTVFSAMAIPKSRDYLADVWYRHGFGEPSLFCKIGWGGQILESHVGKTVCGVSLAKP